MRIVVALIVVGIVTLGAWAGLQQRRTTPHLTPTLEPVRVERPLKDLLSPNFDKGKISLLVEKSKYRLTVVYQNREVKRYSIVLDSRQLKSSPFLRRLTPSQSPPSLRGDFPLLCSHVLLSHYFVERGSL